MSRKKVVDSDLVEEIKEESASVCCDCDSSHQDRELEEDKEKVVTILEAQDCSQSITEDSFCNSTDGKINPCSRGNYKVGDIVRLKSGVAIDLSTGKIFPPYMKFLSFSISEIVTTDKDEFFIVTRNEKDMTIRLKLKTSDVYKI